MRLKTKRQGGIGLLELMLSLAVIALLLVMAIRYFTSARIGQQVNEGISLATALVAASESWVVGKADFTGISIDKLKQQGLLPDDIKTDGTNSSPWHTNVILQAFNNSSQVKLDFQNIPSQACASLTEKLGRQMNTVSSSCGDARNSHSKGNFSAIF